MSNQQDYIENRIMRRDKVVTESNDEDHSFAPSLILNWSLGIVRLCIMIYSLFVIVSHIYVLDKSIHHLDSSQVYNLIFEILACDFVIHDALAAGGWMPGVSNSLFLLRFAKLIPYYSHKQNYQYFTSIPKNYLRAALLLFVASINNSNNTHTLLHDIRIINIALIAFALCFLVMGYLSAIKGKLRPFYVDWILESAKNMDTKQSLAYETNTWLGWISIAFNVLFLLFILAVYIYILSTISDTMDLFVLVACVAKCLLSLWIVIYLILHRRAILEVNWCSIFILLFSLNASINLVYDFKIDTPVNEYCVYIWFVSLLIELIRFVCIIVMYFRSMYRYYTPFKFFYLEIAEWHHFWLTRQGISNMGLILVMLALPFLWVAIKSNWFVIDMAHTPFFDFESPLTLKEFNIDQYLQIFEDIWDEIDTFLDYVGWTDIPDPAMCVIIIAAFAAILSAGVAPFGGTAAGAKYKIERTFKFVKRIVEMFKKVYDTVKALIDKIKAVVEKVQAMVKRVQQFVTVLDSISPKYIGITSVAGLFGVILIPCSTIIIIVYISFLDRSLRFNKFELSAHTRPWFWILFTFYLLLLNIANLLVLVSLHALFTEVFVFETVVFSSQVVYLDGYHALFIVHILIIVGLSLFILDRFLMRYCAASPLYQWTKKPNDMVLHSFCKCKATTPSVQSMIAYLIQYHQWHDADTMTYAAMRACVTGMEGLRNENDKVVEIMSSTCWRCIKYKRFKNRNDGVITRENWEYFLTSYRVGSFPWTQPATARNADLLKQLKAFIDGLYLEDDFISYYVFSEQAADKDVATLNVEGCKQLIVHLRSLFNGDMVIDQNLISDHDLGVKLLLNLSQKQLNELLARFDPDVWRLITAVNVMHANEDTQQLQAMNVEAQPEGNGPGSAQIQTTHTNVSEIEMNPIHRPQMETKVEEEEEEEHDELPSDWEELVDENDRSYYYNTATKETVWERPAKAMDTVPIIKDTDIQSENDDARSDHEQDPEDHNEDQPLPQNWEKIVGENEVPYYHNLDTGERQWERPTNTKKYSIEKPIPKRVDVDTDTDTDEKDDGRHQMQVAHRAGGSVTVHKNVQDAATQTHMSLNGIFERKIIYHQFFQIAMNDILIQSNLNYDASSNGTTNNASIDERETKLIDSIDTQWIKMNETLLIQLNRDNGVEDFAPNKFAPETVLQALGEEGFTREIDFALPDSEEWFQYLENALIEYNNNHTRNGLILLFPKQQHFETWCIYIILTALISAFAIYSLVSFEFMSMTYQPTLELDNTVSALVKSKESLVTEWESVNFESYFDFYEVSDDQFYDCDIGSIFEYLPINPLKKYNSFSTFLSSMIEGFTVADIPLIELLDEIDNFEVNGELLQVIDVPIDFELNANVNTTFRFVQFPMIDINTWPAITISFYAEWYFMLLFGPVFGFILVCGMCIAGWRVKKFEINKQLIGLFVIFGGFCGLQFVLSLGSVLSVVTTFLPNSIVFLKYEYGYYNMILCNILVMLIGLLIFVDVIAGEHVPTLSRIFDRKKANNGADAQESSMYHLVQYSN